MCILDWLVKLVLPLASGLQLSENVNSWVVCPKCVWKCSFALCSQTLTLYVMYVCSNAATMVHSSDKNNQTTVTLAALHVDTQPTTHHKTLSALNNVKVTRPMQLNSNSPTKAGFASPSVYPHLSLHPTFLHPLPSSSSLFIEPRLRGTFLLDGSHFSTEHSTRV